ncbi:uncharacterized protein NECHADRAFT_84037 [Fusarium vanettenii 77-13-4]|uniref:Uncharacterized protein n=1 Tax=Fusarium vanettenii (strain ATCC MYA-4622 / CBS 123669 / FGSC 9596 / NRRL 45880 / 77-13-4) TaxID=660122 RepID=C7YZI1_FUSV7|nr:uncharacterized protein NECHADRAFT_84037 [Fusarium vanettenii 77-13-4]EEU42609.1 hypothetical protein NECHADRAFT_84037 [Fusarium vanettenii 77-13-4]
MDHASSHSSSAPATTYYQPVPYRETQGHEEEESQQANLDPITSEPDTSENENGDPQGSEMPRMERHGLDLATILGDVAAVASPVALIVFAVMVLCIDGSEASETSYAKWNNATTVLGTLFPIIFASTCVTLNSNDSQDRQYGSLGKRQDPFQVSNLVQAYTISKPWITLCFVSCIVLLCSGVLSVVFAHLADSPEILGYASTAVRDSKFLELWPEVGGMAAIDITKMMRGERLRYGITHLTRKGQRLLGVGREAETEEIKDRFV